jgi:NAD(P)-dependent dehydrogenase (short-subunit alcohol dehydrogenase family)
MLNPMSLEGRTVLVTGASSGIGRETAVVLSKLGARLVLVGRNPERLQQTLDRMEPREHVVEALDLTPVEDLSGWMKGLVQKAGRLHGLVHSAGIYATKPLPAVRPADMRGIFEINVNAAVELARAFRQRSVCAGGGSIVFLSSVMSLAGAPATVAYAASKGALNALTRSMAVELAREKIRVNSVAAGHVATEMSDSVRGHLTPEWYAAIEAAHPLGTGTATDVAYAVAFLLADTGRWITGSTLVVDGGFTAQ